MSPNQLSGEDIHRTPPGDHRGCPRGFHPHTNLLGLRGCSLSMKPEVNTVRRKVKEETSSLSLRTDWGLPASPQPARADQMHRIQMMVSVSQ